MTITKFTALPAVLLLMAGCTTLAAIDETSTPSANPQLERMLIATTRARSLNPGDLYSGERGARLDHAKVTVSIPPVHKAGTLEKPRFGAPSTARHFTLHDRAYVDSEDAFKRAVNAELAARPKENRDILLFVHGYNNDFRDSVLHFSQFAHDTGFAGARVLFSWASRGSPVEYFYDRESATIARDGFERTLRLLAQTNVRKVHIMAHSMGNWVAMESLRQLQISGNATLGGKVGEVILASPDIDVDVFKSQMRRLGQPVKPYHLLISRDDRALSLSQRLSGNLPRVGNFSNDREIAQLGIIVYDATSVKSAGKLGHAKFADAPQIVQLLGRRLSKGNVFADNKPKLSDRLHSLGRNVGNIVVTTGEIVIHAPETVLTRPEEIIAAPVEVLNKTVKGSKGFSN
ncbi:MAG: alpha/beta hydrolase [Rhizobiales bacterium]|nr:alpha/beta hydrolase [Hyphomicrobiales bacterium]